MPKLIFVEGVSGVGKSTTTQKLCDKLRGMGYSVDRCLIIAGVYLFKRSRVDNADPTAAYDVNKRLFIQRF